MEKIFVLGGLLKGIGHAILWAIKTAIVGAKGKALIAFIAKATFTVFFLLALAAGSMLPRSPFTYALGVVAGMANQIPYMRYLAAFIPFVAIMVVTAQWLLAVIGFHVLKVILRQANILK